MSSWPLTFPLKPRNATFDGHRLFGGRPDVDGNVSIYAVPTLRWNQRRCIDGRIIIYLPQANFWQYLTYIILSSDIKAKASKFIKTLSIKIYINRIRAVLQKLKVDICIIFQFHVDTNCVI